MAARARTLRRSRPPRQPPSAGPLGARAEAEEAAGQDQEEVEGWRGADAEEAKGHGGQYSAARVQTLLEQNADAVYGAAAFFVTLAMLILALTPTAIEVDAGGNPVRATHLQLNLPSAFRVKLSKIAHSVKDTLSHVDWTPRSELGVGMESGLAGVGIGAGGGGGGNRGGGGGGGVGGGGGGALSSDIIQENRALRTEVTELQSTVARLQASLQTTACLSITAAREGLCLPPLQASSAAAARASTRDKAVLRPAGYRRVHKRWAAAKDHWATQYVNFKSPKRRIGFEINTHNPDTEDIYISRAVHRREIWDKPVFNVLKHVLVSKGLPPGRVLDVGGNIGYFTMWALAMGHKVTTFEPMDFNVRYIVTSIDANNFGANHTLYQNAVGNQAGRLALQPTNKQNRGNFQVQMVNGAAGELHGEYGLDYVDTVRLDDLVDEDVHLIKIDVEGFEHKVLDGARKLVCSRLVRYIEFEFTTAKSDGDCHAEQVLCWFATIGYRITSVDAVEHARTSAEAADLNVHDWANFPSELLLTLKDSLLPPGLLLELSGECVSLEFSLALTLNRDFKHELTLNRDCSWICQAPGTTLAAP